MSNDQHFKVTVLRLSGHITVSVRTEKSNSQQSIVIFAATIAKLLDKAIEYVGLSGQGFTAKSFRPTGAMLAVEMGVDPDVVMKLGRWKTRSVFMDHYVHAKPPKEFTDNLFNL